jgi:hypothetical protein
MADRKKKPTKKPSGDRKSKELDAEELEKVSGGLLGTVDIGSYKPQFKYAPEQNLIGDPGILPALKK